MFRWELLSYVQLSIQRDSRNNLAQILARFGPRLHFLRLLVIHCMQNGVGRPKKLTAVV